VRHEWTMAVYNVHSVVCMYGIRSCDCDYDYDR
jgi:hypothetical protein